MWVNGLLVLGERWELGDSRGRTLLVRVFGFVGVCECVGEVYVLCVLYIPYSCRCSPVLYCRCVGFSGYTGVECLSVFQVCWWAYDGCKRGKCRCHPTSHYEDVTGFCRPCESL